MYGGGLDLLESIMQNTRLEQNSTIANRQNPESAKSESNCLHLDSELRQNPKFSSWTKTIKVRKMINTTVVNGKMVNDTLQEEVCLVKSYVIVGPVVIIFL